MGRINQLAPLMYRAVENSILSERTSLDSMVDLHNEDARSSMVEHETIVADVRALMFELRYAIERDTITPGLRRVFATLEEA